MAIGECLGQVRADALSRALSRAVEETAKERIALPTEEHVGAASTVVGRHVSVPSRNRNTISIGSSNRSRMATANKGGGEVGDLSFSPSNPRWLGAMCAPSTSR